MATLTYHYCTMHQTEDGIAYNDGVFETPDPITKPGFKRFRDHLQARIGLPGRFTILSLTRL